MYVLYQLYFYYIEMIPYLDAILQNNLISLKITEKMDDFEWVHISRALFVNYSLQKFHLLKQTHLTNKIWCLILCWHHLLAI